MSKTPEKWPESVLNDPEIAKFAESYDTFNRIINSLQRKYLQLQEDFTAQNDRLVEANTKLVDLSEKNLIATEFLNNLLDSIAVGVIAVNKTGEITHFNPAASRIHGIPKNEPLGKRYRDIIPVGLPVEANALRTMESGKTVSSAQKTVELTDGTKLQLSVSTALLTDNEKQITGAVEVIHDLTQLKKMERELARLNTLAALGEMAATIAHQVRNPLAAIGGFAALLEKDIAAEDPKLHLIGKIKSGVDSLNKTIESVLHYTRYEELNITPVDFAHFIHTLVGQFTTEQAAELKQMKFSCEQEPKHQTRIITAHIDRLLFRELLFNLLQNAVDACSGKGKVSIRFTMLSHQNAVAIYGDRLMPGLEETLIMISITDTGNGVADEHKDKIFSPFYTTRSNGNGLGLAVVWKLVKAHGGDIFIEDSKGGGAVFTLLLPTPINQ